MKDSERLSIEDKTICGSEIGKIVYTRVMMTEMMAVSKHNM